MTKAYDAKELVAKLKGKGLDVAEAAAKEVVLSVFEWLEESATISPTPYDNVLLIIYPEVKKLAMTAIDKIDGAEG